MKDGHSQTYPPGLYIVATPIGNLGDITLRALEALKAADLIACEDTRVTAKLLSHFGIGKPTLSYNDHNGADRRPQIIKELQAGKRVALVSDAGTPLISDPGYKLAREALALGIAVTTLPGPSSVMAALCLSGLPTDKFYFAGFLPPKVQAAKDAILSFTNLRATIVLFEAANRLEDTLALLRKQLGNRDAAVVREITKLFEESKRGTLDELLEYYAHNGAPKGEIVLLIGPPQEEAISEEDLIRSLNALLASNGVKEASTILAEQTGRPRKEIYTLALKLIQDQ